MNSSESGVRTFALARIRGDCVFHSVRSFGGPEMMQDNRRTSMADGIGDPLPAISGAEQ